MPSSVTHSYFCNDVYEKVDRQVKEKLSGTLNYFKAFGQGPDYISFMIFIFQRDQKWFMKLIRLCNIVRLISIS